jgi:hypothetical protein
MSTIDPVARDREPGIAARRRLRWLVLSAVAALVAGYGASIFGDFPGSSYSFGLDQTGPLLKAVLLLAGLIGALLSIGIAVRLPRTPGIRGQQTFVVAGALLAFDVGMLGGTFLPTSIAEFAGTDLSGARGGVRIMCGVLAVAGGCLVGWAAMRERRRDHRAELRKSGRRVSATVTEVHDTGVTNNNAPWVRITVRFTDSHGTQRFARRHMSVSRFAGPSEGDKVPLWYDPEDPGNEKKIVIGDS